MSCAPLDLYCDWRRRESRVLGIGKTRLLVRTLVFNLVDVLNLVFEGYCQLTMVKA